MITSPIVYFFIKSTNYIGKSLTMDCHYCGVLVEQLALTRRKTHGERTTFSQALLLSSDNCTGPEEDNLVLSLPKSTIPWTLTSFVYLVDCLGPIQAA